MIHQGDALSVLRTLPDESAQMCVTSPPYFGLRDYGIPPTVWGGDPSHPHDFATETVKTEVGRGNWAQGVNGRGEQQPGGVEAKREPIRATAKRGFCECGAWLGTFGLEPTPALFVEHAVSIFDEVRRVLKDDGVLWLNLGDSYCNSDKWGGGGANTGKHTKEADGTPASWKAVRRRWAEVPGIKPKDLIGIPWRVAFALQEAGWYLRCDIIWSKPNPMPESVTDRPTKAHEYIFLLSKSERYLYNTAAIAEKAVYPGDNRASRTDTRESEPLCIDKGSRARTGNPTGDTRNRRSVWNISTRPFTEWGETSRRVPVALDAIDDDTKRTTSPDCPLHGDHAALVPNGSCGEREGASPSSTERTSVRPAQEPSLGSEPIGSHHAQDSLAGSSGSSVPEHEAPATSRSTGSRRRGRAPATIPPCTPSAQTPVCTESIEGVPDSSGSAGRTSESNIEQDGSGDHPSAQSSFRNEDSLCSCAYYRTVTEQISHFATFPEEIPTLCILAGSRPGDVVLDPFNGAGTTGVVCEKLGRSYVGIELNPAYVEMAERRIRNVAPLFNQPDVA